VVGAQKTLGIAFLGATDGIAAMGAGIQHRLDRAVLLADHQNVVAAHHRLKEITRLGNLRLVTEEQP